MEFGFLTQAYVPQSWRDLDPNAEHTVLMDDFELCLEAEKAGFKNIWISEHHFLDEYSHLSASDVFLGALASRTTTAHLGSGIFNPLPKTNHPAKVAERVAMLDHLTEGRFEFGTGRGAGSFEISGFHDELAGNPSGTKPIWEETIREFLKMWTQETYQGFEGESWRMDPRPVLPKPYGKGHPAMWYAAGNPSSYVMAAQKGLGVLGFSLDTIDVAAGIIKSYKDAIEGAEPVGAFVNDNLIVACGFNSIAEDRDAARREFLQGDIGYHMSQVFRYHDTFPRPEGLPVWPDLIPDPDEAMMDGMIDAGSAIVGDPHDALEQVKRWEALGVDQLLMLRGTKTKAQTLEMIRLMGEHVIPKLDKDPVHRTTRMREAASVAVA
jgi:alkanesulfonate monooxygenase SsuD/methylene tetrahydromethanopterin reductase-like flavin-dependent oxidoreductase (luciferase family)